MDERYFKYLDDLRQSGVTNMFGAGPYLAFTFVITKSEAREILARWMTSFAERQTEDQT